MRSVMHFRMESFCAALEQLRTAELAGKPVVVVHNSGRGDFVVSASREAMAQGVRESMTARHAGRYSPKAVIVRADWELYHERSEAVMDILSAYSPMLEPHAIDKAYMDVGGSASLFGSPADIAAEVRSRVAEEIGIPIAVGVGGNKLVACAASGSCKPGEYLEIAPGDEQEFLGVLPVASLPGVGAKIEKRLTLLGVKTAGELASIPEQLLLRQFGELGAKLYKLSRGIDFSPVLALYPPLTIHGEHLFDANSDESREPDYVETYLFRMCENLAAKLRRRNEHADVVLLNLEFENNSVLNRRYKPKTAVSSIADIFNGARRLLREEMRGDGIRSMTLTLSGLRSGGGIQLSITGDTERRMRLDSVIETIRARFGEKAVLRGGMGVFRMGEWGNGGMGDLLPSVRHQ